MTDTPPVVSKVTSLPFVIGRATDMHGCSSADVVVTTNVKLYKHRKHGRQIENLGATVVGVQEAVAYGGLLLHLVT
jgi:hypothetical protein